MIGDLAFNGACPAGCQGCPECQPIIDALSGDIDGNDRAQINHYNSRALGILAALNDYEEEHPKGGLCFKPELDSMLAKAGQL